MKKLLIITAFLLGCLFLITSGFFSNTTNIFSWSFASPHDIAESQETFPFSDSGALSVRTTNGSIRILTHDKPELLIKEKKEGDEKEFEYAVTEKNVSESAASFKTVYTKTDVKNVSISYEITVPAGTVVTARTANGSVNVIGITGTVKAQSTNGKITLERCPRISQATSINGSIAINANELISVGTTTIETTNGSIRFACKQVTDGSFEISTTNGSIKLDLPVPTERTEITHLPQSSSGDAATFTLSNARFNIETTNGDIKFT